MRVLRDYGAGTGALLLVLGFILTTVVPERRSLAISIALFGLTLIVSGLVLDRKRVALILKGRRGRSAGASAGYILVVTAIVVLVNFIAGRHHARYDVTENKAFSLSPQTIRVLETLPGEVRATAFHREGEPGRGRLEELVEEYRYHSDKLTWRFVDPDKNPGEVGRFEIRDYGTIVFESAGRESRTTTADEESLTNALIKVTREDQLVAYVTTGHGERSLEERERSGLSLLAEALLKQDYRVAPAALTSGVPEDAGVLVIAGPDRPFLPEQIGMVNDYLNAGGRALVLIDPGTDPGLAGILSAFGLAVRRDVVIDKVSQIFGGDARMPVIDAAGYDPLHAVTRGFKYQTLYPMVSSIRIAETLPERVSVSRLARTSDASWGETNVSEVESGSITYDEGVDTRGPVVVAAAASRRIGEVADDPEGGDTAAEGDGVSGDDAGDRPSDVRREARLVLFGDSDFVTNGYFNMTGNGDLALNAIAWLAEREELVSIRPQPSQPHLVVLTSDQIRYYFLTIVVLMPVSIAAAGIAVWIRRRRL